MAKPLSFHQWVALQKLAGRTEKLFSVWVPRRGRPSKNMIENFAQELGCPPGEGTAIYEEFLQTDLDA